MNLIGGGAVGLLFSVPELIENSVSLAKKKYVTEDIKNMREQAEAIQDSYEKMSNELNEIRDMLKELRDLKDNIENPRRSDDKKKSLIRFAMKYSRDEATRRWLRSSEAFSKLVDLFNFLQKQIDEEEKKNHSSNVDITFVAHGAITDQMIPASCLLPLDTIKDVVLYSPWNCTLEAGAVYDIAMGIINPQDRVFSCGSNSCKIPDEKHQPTKLPGDWNSLKRAEGTKIPNITLSPLNPSKDGAWERFEKLEDEYGRPGRNRILIPFIIPEDERDIPFTVVSLALSLVLIFSRFQATLHLTACLGKTLARMNLDEDALREQYAYTINRTGMTSSVSRRKRKHGELYKKLNRVFGKRPIQRQHRVGCCQHPEECWR